jgi:tetratricopeptide (TPR) repeat protein
MKPLVSISAAIGLLFSSAPASGQRRDMGAYSDIQHVVLPSIISSRTTVERVPLRAAFDLVVPGGRATLFDRLLRLKRQLISGVRELPQVRGAPRRYRVSVKIYNFDAWLERRGGRLHLYVARQRAPFGGTVSVPMIPYYPDVEIPDLQVGEPTFFAMDPRTLSDEVARLRPASGKTVEDQAAYAKQVLRAAQSFNSALEFLDQVDLDAPQLRLMAGRARQSMRLFGLHPAGQDASHLLAEILYDLGSRTDRWEGVIGHLKQLAVSKPRRDELQATVRYQRAVYRLGRAMYQRNKGTDLFDAARFFKRAGQSWQKQSLPLLTELVEGMIDAHPDDEDILDGILQGSEQIAEAAVVAEMETLIRSGRGQKEEALLRAFIGRKGVLADTARYRLGTILYANGSFDLAAPMLRNAYRMSPAAALQQPAMGVIVAEALRIMGDEKLAANLLEQAIEMEAAQRAARNDGRKTPAPDPEDATALAFATLRLGDLSWKANDLIEAERWYRRSVRDFPKVEGGMLARIRLVEITGEVQGEDFPLEVYRALQARLTRISPGSAEEAMYREARARFLRNEFTQANDKLLELQDEFPNAFLLQHDAGLIGRVRLALMEELYEQGRYAEVAEAFRLTGEALDAKVEGARTLFLGGSALSRLSLHRYAVEAFQRALNTADVRADKGSEEEVLVALSRSYLGTLDLFRARQTLDYQAALYPKGKHAGTLWTLRGEIEEAAKRPDKAVLAYREAIGRVLEPLLRADLYVRIGRLESDRGAPAGAATALARAIETVEKVGPADPPPLLVDATFRLGDAHYRLRNWRQAAQAYDKGVQIAQEKDLRVPMAHYRIGAIRAILGDLAGALQDWSSLSGRGTGLWHVMARAAAVDLTWRIRHDGLLNEGG